MTTFYLHWWCTGIETPENASFYHELWRLSESNGVLVLPYSRIEDDWSPENTLLNKLHSFYPDFNISNIQMWSKNKFRLVLQILKAKVIFIPWWDYCSLFDQIWYLKFAKNIFKEKYLFAVSAWASVLCEYSYSDDYAKVFPWLGIIENACKCHYNSIKDKNKIQKLEEYSKNDNVLKIKEKEYILIQN